MKSNGMREILIKKGTKLFYRDGFARSSIRDIGRFAGVSSSTLYHYFKNKDELLYEIITSIGDALLKILKQTIQDFDDPEERLRQMMFRQICLFKDKREEVKIYIEEQYQLPKRLKEIVAKQHKVIYDTYLHELERLHAAGRLRIDNLPIINFAIFALMNWFYRWYKEDKSLSIEEIAKILIAILSNGIFSPDNRREGVRTRGKGRREELQRSYIVKGLKRKI